MRDIAAGGCIRTGSEYFDAGGITNALGQNRNSGSFVGSHQRRLLKQFSQVAVEGGIPADHRLERQAVYLGIVVAAGISGPSSARKRAGRIEGIVGFKAYTTRVGNIASIARGLAIERQSEQAIDPGAPRVQLARGLGVGVDDAGHGSDTLQPDRLPHQQKFFVDAGVHDEQVARLRVVNGGLNAVRGSHVRRSFAADGDGNGVDGLFPIRCSDHQFTALCR